MYIIFPILKYHVVFVIRNIFFTTLLRGLLVPDGTIYNSRLLKKYIYYSYNYIYVVYYNIRININIIVVVVVVIINKKLKKKKKK